MIARDAIVGAGRSWIGTPYRHQASLKGVGCDCLGLLRGVWRDLLGPEPETVPAYSKDWAEAGGREDLLEAATRHLVRLDGTTWRAGDILLFRWREGLPAKHCGVATSKRTMVHAHDGASVAEVAVAPWWDRRIAATFSFPGAEP